MKKCLFFLMAILVFFAAVQAFGATLTKPAAKAKTPPAVQETKSPETTYYALIIGNNQYKYLPKLKTARNDAIEVEKILKGRLGFQTQLLFDASRSDILGHINQMRKILGEKDSLLIYYAGHGEFDKNVDKSYWLPVDAQRDDPTNWIIADDITSNIKRLAARHVLVVSDSCYSGTLSRQALTEIITTGEREGYLKKMQERPSRTLMASGGNEPVSDSGGGNNSVFAAAFIKSLKESERESFTAEEIFHSRIKTIVAGKSDQVPEYSSIKNSGDEGGDFVFRLPKKDAEPIKTVADIKGQRQVEDDQVEKELMKIKEERLKLELEKAQIEKNLKLREQEQELEGEQQNLAEEKQRLEEEKQLAASRPSKPFSTSSAYTDPTTGMEFVLIPAGSFTMSSPAKEIGRFDDREDPQHKVDIASSFYLGKYEVTIGQFRKFVQETKYKTEAETGGGTHFYVGGKWEKKAGVYWDRPGFTQTDRHPVICVSWNDVQKFIKWLNQKSGSSYRLPTEEEWEYAARAGTRTSRYWGENPDQACSYANVSDQTKGEEGQSWNLPRHECKDGYFNTAPVGSFRPNAFGLYDMLGNVFEWCIDRIIRGGAWNVEPRYVRAAARGYFAPEIRINNLGFRLIRTK